MVWVRLEVLLPPLRLGQAISSGSRGVGSGGGKCRLVRSGKEPPVLMAGGRTGVPAGWSGDGKMLQGDRKRGDMGAVVVEGDGGLPHFPQSLGQPNRGTYLIPGTSQDRGREEDEDS